MYLSHIHPTGTQPVRDHFKHAREGGMPTGEILSLETYLPMHTLEVGQDGPRWRNGRGTASGVPRCVIVEFLLHS